LDLTLLLLASAKLLPAAIKLAFYISTIAQTTPFSTVIAAEDALFISVFLSLQLTLL